MAGVTAAGRQAREAYFLEGDPMPNRSVRDVIAGRKPLTAPGRTTVCAAAALMKRHHVGALMVVEHGRLAGIFTERDAVFRVLAEGRDPATTRVSEVMTSKPRTIDADKAVGHALMIMYDGGFRHVPVVENGKPLGMISARDALGPELHQFETELVQREHIGEVL
jgi:CBS domain-containing protein